MDFFDICIHNVSYSKHMMDKAGDNSISIGTVKSILPSIITCELTPRQRECITMHYYQNMTQQQIAQELGLAQPTVCKNIKTAKIALNRILKYVLLAGNMIVKNMD